MNTPELYTMACGIQAHQKMSSRRPPTFGKELDAVNKKKTPMGNPLPEDAEDVAGKSDGVRRADNAKKANRR